MNSVTPRDLALKALNRQEDRPGSLKQFLEYEFQEAPHLSQRDRAFTVHLLQGVLRWQLRLDWIIQQNIRFPFRKIEPPVLNILRLALYQIFFMDRVPESAAVNEAVKQAKSIKSNHVVSFVNGILRSICREEGQITFPDRDKDPVRYLSVFYSYPTWLVDKWIRETGIDSTERILSAGNRITGLVIRANMLKVDRPSLIKRLKVEGVECKPTLYSPDGIAVEGLKGPVDGLDTFKEGLFQVQSEPAQICARLLLPKPGERILDICAGLGGKSTHMAELMGDKGEIVALDMNYKRLLRLVQSSYRLGMSCIQPMVADAVKHTFPMAGRRYFDRILVDGPCSALGTISRHPDAKWIRGEADIRRLSVLQRKILNNAVPLLREEGKLLYVTCTISREENEDVVRDFLGENRRMVLEDMRKSVPDWGLDLIDDHGFFKTLPHDNGMDGFFGALFVKSPQADIM
ncbi:MAG: 16S rRNA (cytosine(967)-C(5))-methyltransferase [Desulfobacteraceae bacterium 4484_190.2]|nr:MAG: 16S rRNA (cytosine(967)-C(5))-methyltransferase [Desulfobacteraceae bacterium 4484_190.2]